MLTVLRNFHTINNDNSCFWKNMFLAVNTFTGVPADAKTMKSPGEDKQCN